jgi:carbon storage regulator
MLSAETESSARVRFLGSALSPQGYGDWCDGTLAGHGRPFQKGITVLVLSRKINESVMVGDTVEVIVVEVRGDKVRLGINAPVDVPVHRREVYDYIKRAEEQGNGPETSVG